jgi:hypothetical protein
MISSNTRESTGATAMPLKFELLEADMLLSFNSGKNMRTIATSAKTAGDAAVGIFGK